MATTTNYGWETPDDTDLVKDGAAAIRTLGNSVDTTTKNLNPETTLGDLAYRSATANVNTRLALGTANQVLRVNSGGTAPEWATTADQTPLTTKGDLFGFDTADARIPIGTNGHILTADSTQSLGLKWAAPAGGGKVLQVVQGTFATQTSRSSNTYADTGLTVSITCSANTSKVLVLVSLPISRTAANESALDLKLDRNGTNIIGNQFNYLRQGVAELDQSIFTYTFLDSPATTSALTYKMQFACRNAAAAVEICTDNDQASIQVLEIGA